MANKTITKIELQNFGKYQEVAFSPGDSISLIRGPNRSGKTWILRALYMLLYNEGQFHATDALDEVRYHDSAGKKAPFFRVRVDFSDGSWVERYRDKATNRYTLCPAGEEPVEHTTIGRGFYEPVGEITGIFPTELDGKNTYTPNIRLPGHPRFFLVGESGNQQDAILTRLVGVDVIEEAAYQTNLDRKRLGTELGNIEVQLEEAETELESYHSVPSLIQKLKKAAGFLNVWKELEGKTMRGKELIQKRGVTGATISRYATLPKLATLLALVEGHIIKAESLGERGVQVRQLLGRRELLRQKAEMAEVWVETLKGKLSGFALAIRKGRDGAQAAQDAREALEGGKALVEVRKSLTGTINAKNEKIVGVTEKRKSLLEEAGICPLCGQKIGE